MSYEIEPQTGPLRPQRSQMLKGLVELALLSLLEEEPCYGLDILERLRTDAGLNLAEGAVYPLLHRLEKAGWTLAEWRFDPDNGRPRKYYAITDAGRAELRAQLDSWSEMSARLTQFLARRIPS
ncbi:PadR family transcriptional regulator [Brevundimonas sp. Root1423]|uniref:PadR family transcriptional regulator n=1 Tax=Brevundimonas sp. Root1423 TaxID=1736462 RepID=UPI0006F87D68|nr:PadR family transcriptional regulator [Brevundimonas sp. Root1423]KQY89788.1 PadR family transcriptional regulator [Brevundimonas sp. Root1423]